MDKQWKQQIETWEKLRAEADVVIKGTLAKHFPCENAKPKLDNTHKSYHQEELSIGRALWAYARSDLTIKTIQLKCENSKHES